MCVNNLETHLYFNLHEANSMLAECIAGVHGLDK
jgi:hypothetical protein